VPNSIETTLPALAGETRVFGFDFSLLAELRSENQMLSSPGVAGTPTGLTISNVMLNPALFDGVPVGQCVTASIAIRRTGPARCTPS